MKKLYCFFILPFSCLCVSAQIVTISDVTFKAKLLQADTTNEIAKNLSGNFFKIDANSDNEIQLSEAAQVSYLDVQRDFSVPSDGISSLVGILSFVNLQHLNCVNHNLPTLNLNGLSSLITLDCSGNQMTTMNLTGLVNLESLICAGTGNQFVNLDVSNLTNLKTLVCAFNGLSSINLTGLTNLELLSCGFNNFTTLDVSGLTSLQYFYCSFVSPLTTLDVSGLTNLQEFSCTGNANLQELHISQNPLVALTISDLPNLITLECTDTPLTALDVTTLVNLQTLDCSGNQLQTLNVNTLVNLQTLDCSDNQLTSLFLKNGSNETSLNMADNPGLLYVCTDASQVATVQSLVTSYGYTDCVVDSACSTSLPGIVTIPDGNFKAKLLAANSANFIAKDLSGNFFKIDANNDAEIQLTEAEQVSYLDVEASEIASLEGISSFVNLLVLRCSDNLLTAMDLNGLSNLLELHCSDNQINTLNLEFVPNLQILHCNDNILSTLDVNTLSNLQELHCSDNQLVTLFLKNGSAEALEIENNPNLEYICADVFQFPDIQLAISANGYTNCTLNTYCTFLPGGGTFYTIQGNNNIDANNNGCDTNDPTFANAKFTISDGTTTETLIANGTGTFSFNVLEGNYTITPILENPAYFSVFPTSATVNFSGPAGFFNQDFCYAAIGFHNDLEVSMVPLTEAVPGFDIEYRILFKNKGNQTQSGTITLTFDDTILDLVTSSPTLANQSANNLFWNFTNLQPFETRVITLTLNVNSPMESPAVNDGDILAYTAVVNSIATDEMPNDNTFVLNQGVVNSFDPNDKTCLEGTAVSTTKVGDYVHYMIRFENTGSAPAKNIVVKDVIDTTKFDISSIIPAKGSHEFYTKINANEVEFIFENINLPFNDASNDGYVIFKIKTKPTLVIGDAFSNTASIYFDYNFPIVTNTATTTIEALNTSDFGFENDVNFYPNPVNAFFNLDANNSLTLKSLAIYNAIGQLVLAFPDVKAYSKFDVTSLSTGNYLIKIHYDKGIVTKKFIKQ